MQTKITSKKIDAVDTEIGQFTTQSENIHQVFFAMEDKEVWKAFKDGNKDAFSYIYQTYVQNLFAFGQQIIADKELIKDCIHNLFVDISSKSSSKDSEVISIKSYLYKSLYRLLVRTSEKGKRIILFDNQEKFEGFTLDFSDDKTLVDEEYLNQKKKKIAIAVNQLPKRQREAFMYFFYEGFTYEEIASIMELKQIHSARKLIYKAISKIKEGVGKKITLYSISLIVIIYLCWQFSK